MRATYIYLKISIRSDINRSTIQSSQIVLILSTHIMSLQQS